MTTLLQARDAVQSAVTTAWNNATSSLPLLWDNVKTDTPTVGAWGRSIFSINFAGQSTQGRNRYLTEGVVVIQFFGPPGDGYLVIDGQAQAFMDELRGIAGAPDGFWFFDIFPTPIGIVEGKAQLNVNASFRYQEAIS